MPSDQPLQSSSDGVPIASVAGFFGELDKTSPGNQVLLRVVRNGREADMLVTLDEWPAGVNPFTNPPEVDSPEGSGSPAAQYPFVPRLPGFSFPCLYPDSP